MFVLLFVILFEVQARINPHGPTVVTDFTNCVSELMDQNFNETGLILFANTNNVSTSVARIRAGLFNKIYSNLKYSVEVKTPTSHEPICTADNVYDDHLAVIHMDQFAAIVLVDYLILVIDSYEDFTFVASRVLHSRIWNPHAKIIVLFFSFRSDETNEGIVEQILTCMFRYNVINIAVVVPKADNIRTALVYSWKPFDPPNYCGYFNATAHNRLILENTCEHGHVKYKKNIFADRLPNSMKGCVLRILALERQPFVSGDKKDPNIERYFVNQLADIYDLKTEYAVVSEASRGERDYESGVWDGALAHLVNKEGHLLLGGIFPDWDVHEDFECSNTYLADAYTWVAPRALQSPKYIALFIIFKSTVWYSAVAGFVLCGFTWKVLGQLSGERFYHRTFRHCFMNTWLANVGFCTYARPRKNSLRIFYVFFNIYCILFLTGYQTKLFDVLTNPTFEEQIDTVEKLVNSGLKFGGIEVLHDLFDNSSDPFDFMLGEKWYDIENLTKALIDVAVHRNFSVLCSRLELAHMAAVMPELNEASGDYKYYAFEQDMFTVPMEMVALRGFAYMDRFSRMLETLKQMGVSSGVRLYFAQLNARKRASLLRAMAPEHPEVPLSIQHLQGGFFALVLGFLSGTVILFIEILIESEYVKQKLKIFITYFKS